MKQIVEPIKSDKVLKEVQDTLLNNFKYGVRNLTVFQVGKATMLRVSDVLALKYADIFDENGKVKERDYIHDKKTGKSNTLYLKPIKNDLERYHDWLVANDIKSEWLFPSIRKQDKDIDKYIDERQYYRVMSKVGDLLGLDYLGTHTMRKTGAYMVYKQTGDIALVQKLLNHSSQEMTLAYLGLDQMTIENRLDNINFG